jgi:two-component system OmpR family response regulator
VTKRVLIVDDDRELCSEIAEILSDEGFWVDTALDGILGYARIQENRYDVILLDIKMPGLSGIEILERIKTGGISGRIFLISGKPHLDAFISQGDYTGLVAGILPKPFNIELLISKIKE